METLSIQTLMAPIAAFQAAAIILIYAALLAVIPIGIFWGKQ